MKKILSVVSLAAGVMFVGVSFVEAGTFPGQPDNIWKGPVPSDINCPAEYVPVYDARGNIYSNSCEAFLDGARVTWDA